MDIYLIRHGKTEGNKRKAYIGITDEPVSPEGLEELRAMPAYHSCNIVYITPLLRTKMTADVFFPNATKLVVEDFREMNFGIFEGKNYADLAENQEYRQWVEGNCVGCCPLGESIVDFAQKVSDRFKQLVDEALAEGKESLTCVVHGGVIMSLCYQHCSEKREFYDWWIDNGQCRHFALNQIIWRETHTLELVEE
ncbi:MAG: phosphoglycerate mutase family protein [Eubacteriales bacterium]